MRIRHVSANFAALKAARDTRAVVSEDTRRALLWYARYVRPVLSPPDRLRLDEFLAAPRIARAAGIPLDRAERAP